MKEKDLERFRELYQEKNGEKLEIENAEISLEKLLSMIRLIYKPIKKKTGS